MNISIYEKDLAMPITPWSSDADQWDDLDTFQSPPTKRLASDGHDNPAITKRIKYSNMTNTPFDTSSVPHRANSTKSLATSASTGDTHHADNHTLRQESTDNSHFTSGETMVRYLLSEATRLVNEARSRDLAAGQNTPGDARVKAMILTLLARDEQRKLFMSLMRSPTAYPRATSLFGAPPYSFLMPEDAYMLSASGFSRGRVHMAYAAAGQPESYAQFGIPQYLDQYKRHYRTNAILKLLQNQVPATLDMTVRLPKISKAEQQAKRNDPSLQIMARVPMPRTELQLSIAPSLTGLLPPSMRAMRELKVVVTQVKMPEQPRSTASIRVRVM